MSIEHIDKSVSRSYKMLGFVMRLSRKFNPPNAATCTDMLYNALVRSILEYATPQSTYIHKIERVQKKYTRFRHFLTRTPYEGYIDRMNVSNMISLESRRIYFDACLLHDIIHKEEMSALKEGLTYRTTERPHRRNNRH